MNLLARVWDRTSVVESKAEAGGEDEIIGDGAGDGIADIAVAYGALPAEPVLDFRGHANIQRETVLAQMAQLGIDIERFIDGSGCSDLMTEERSEERRVGKEW